MSQPNNIPNENKLDFLIKNFNDFQNQMKNIIENNHNQIKDELQDFKEDVNQKINMLNHRIIKLENKNNLNNNHLAKSQQLISDSTEKLKSKLFLKDNNELNESFSNESEEESKHNDNKSIEHKIRGKYKKNTKKVEFRKSIQYVNYYDNDKFWKYSLSSFNETNKTGYYYCSDTSCKGRGMIKYELDINTEYNKLQYIKK